MKKNLMFILRYIPKSSMITIFSIFIISCAHNAPTTPEHLLPKIDREISSSDNDNLMGEKLILGYSNQGVLTRTIDADFQEVLDRTYLPDGIEIEDFKIDFGDGLGKRFILALTPEEDALAPTARNKILHDRVQKICNATLYYPYNHAIKIRDVEDELIVEFDFDQKSKKSSMKKYNTKEDVEYYVFRNVTCGSKPNVQDQRK
jgi:hypothetical protein